MKALRITLLAACAMAASLSLAQTPAKLKVGLMLPYTGTYAALGIAIENGFRLQIAEQGGK
ncbi:MAG: ABC transporter permease, partial [Rhodoferax sp.]